MWWRSMGLFKFLCGHLSHEHGHAGLPIAGAVRVHLSSRDRFSYGPLYLGLCSQQEEGLDLRVGHCNRYTWTRFT